MVKKGYYRNDGLSLAWDLGIIFLDIPNCPICENWGSKKKGVCVMGLKNTLLSLISSF